MSCENWSKLSGRVLVLSSSDSELDQLVVTALKRFGNNVTVGPEYSLLDSTTSFGEFDVVYLQANANWMTDDMPIEGQQALARWVRCGGGLLTVEWTTWKAAALTLTTLQQVFPVEPSTGYGATALAAYERVGNDETVHFGLPARIVFPSDDFGGTETDLLPREGATVFYDSEERLAGVVGWEIEEGRAASVSSTAGPAALGEADYARLLGNLVSWLRAEPARDPL